MKKFALLAAGFGMVYILFAFPAIAGEKAPSSVVNLAYSTLMDYGVDPVIVGAVRDHNAQGKTLKQIKEMDEKWKGTPGVADFMRALMTSDCGKRLKQIQNSASYFAEIFVMDNQGANVALTDKTSDYWQGDEDKFTQSYKNGTGGVHISDVEFDDSAQAYLVQVSVPVKDAGTVIGAMTFGIDLDAFESQ